MTLDSTLTAQGLFLFYQMNHINNYALRRKDHFRSKYKVCAKGRRPQVGDTFGRSCSNSDKRYLASTPRLLLAVGPQPCRMRLPGGSVDGAE